MCLTFRSLVFMLGPLLLGMNVHFQFRCKTIVLWRERGTVWKNQIPSRLGKCEGQSSFALTYQLQFETGIFECVLASLSERRRAGQGKKRFGPLHVPISCRSLVSNLIPRSLSVSRWNRPFSTSLKRKTMGFKLYKTTVLNPRWKWAFIPNKRGTNMETKLLKVRHMSRPNFLFYLGPPVSVLELKLLSVCGLHTSNERLVTYELVEAQDFMKSIDLF